MSTFYASFPEPAKAQYVALTLLSEGIQPDDISVVAHANGTEAALVAEEIEPSEDATAFVGREDDPDQDSLIPEVRDSTSYMVQREAATGGGIATSTPDDNVSRYEEMDDIEAAESDMLDQPADRPHSRHEVDDLQLTMSTGFPTNVPVIDDFEPQRLPGESALTHGLEAIKVPGLGVVMGGGALATAALDLSDGSADAKRLVSHLQDEGVPPQAAEGILEELQHGGAVLAVALVPGESDPDRLQELASRNGATKAEMYDAQRY
jgi:hypothetical protein